MADPGFDVDKAHGYFAAKCFNSAWKGIDARRRTPEDDEQMLAAAHASFWHWTEHPKCNAQNRSVGYWQLSRVYALLQFAEPARQYGEKALRVALETPLPPYFVGYAYEALARAAQVAGNTESQRRFVRLGREVMAKVESEESRRLLETDLEELSD